jgi:3-deoxy-D-manno-octulosonic-acid transferase
VKPPSKSAIAAQFATAVGRDVVGPVLVAGSTLDGEEVMLLQTFRQVVSRYPGALLVLAPRRPEHFEPVASLLSSSGIPYQRRSQWDGQQPLAGRIFLLDSIGELASLYGFADLAFIGGSLVPSGGHNVLEAAQFGAPILVGPHTENFRDIIQTFRKADALRVVTPQSLTTTVLQLLESRDELVSLGRRAADVLRSQQGATEMTVRALLELLPQSARATAELSSERRA